MARVGSADGGDPGRVARDGQPVVYRRTDFSALDRWFPGAMMARHEQDEAVSGALGPLERQVDRPPRAVEAMAVKINDAVGLERARSELSIPRPIEGRAGPRGSGFGGRSGLSRGRPSLRYSGRQ